MLSNPEFLDLISRHLNNPSDLEMQLEVEKYRAESTENDTFFLEIKNLWELSGKASRINEVDADQAIQKFKGHLIKESPKKKTFWLTRIAASILLFSIGYLIYNQSTKTVFTVKSTNENQVDSVRLADGSVVILAENSEVRYPDKFDAIREISLLKGQAFFKIHKDPNHPFKVIMNKSNVVVLGTSFNIKMSKSKIDLGVITGKVIFTPYQNGTTSILTAGQALTYDVTKKEFLTKTAQNSDSWLTKELIFVDTPLEEVCKQLTEYYGANIKLKNDKHAEKKLNATFKYQTLDQVLEILNKTYNIRISKENNQINLITP
ncbi:FecR family protein [Pedobacter frigiditerrae]|uniref:FecR family protein n=1 Tax=Pedobacter frigiditerrae TaxID=2530452 RepID=UPI00292EDF84|nr:FecR domain-containing protein [Pedobacter frigiditerrae]